MSDTESAVRSYVEAARNRLVSLRDPGEATWREIVDRGLSDAFGTGDLLGLARVVQFLVNLLEMQGRFDEALAEVDRALLIVSPNADATAALLALRAAVTVAGGEVTEAVRLAQRASLLAASGLDAQSRARTRALCDVVLLQALQPSSSTPDEALRQAADVNILDYLFGLSWLIPYRCARGETVHVRPLVRSMRALAETNSIAFREADAAVFAYWEEFVRNPSAPAPTKGDSLIANNLASWRLSCLEVSRAVMLREWSAASSALIALQRASRRLRAGTGSADHWGLLVAVSSGRVAEGVGDLLPPLAVTLSNLPSALVGGYVVALCGARHQAATWSRWLERVHAVGVESSLEFPISVRRLCGLLALRAGKPVLARRRLKEASSSCEAAGLVVEASIARLQAVELNQRLLGRHAIAPHVLEESRLARHRVIDLGVDPVPHLYAVQVALAESVASSKRALLAPREIEVLRCLAKGQTYKQAAAELGLAWPTIQTIAHHLYEKLGVNGRFEAIEEAKRLSLL